MGINPCTGFFEGWQALVGIGIMMSFFVVALTFMVGKMLGVSGLIARSKHDVYQVIATMAIAAALVGMSEAACAVNFTDLGLSSSGNMFEIAGDYQMWVVTKSASSLSEVIGWNSFAAIVSSLSGGLPIMGFAMWSSFCSGFGVLSNTMNLLMSSLLIATIIAVAQYALLQYIYASMFKILLPVGIVLRSFPITRELGGALMAIAIGFYLFYPFMLVVDFALMGQPTGTAEPADIFEVLKEQIDWGQMGLDLIKGFVGGNFIAGLIEMVMAIVEIMAGIFLDKVIDSVAQVMLAVFFLPAVNGIVVVAVVRDLSRTLGTEVDVSTLTRMV